MRVLARGPEREALRAALVLGERGARLDRVRDQPVVAQIDLGDVGGAGERLVDCRLVAELPLVDRVARDLVVDQRLALRAGVRGRDAGRQHLVVDRDQLGRVLGLRVGQGDHHGDVIADVARLALGQDRVRAGLHRAAVARVDHPAADQPAPPGRLDVVASEDREHARCCRRLALVDAVDLGVGVGRAHEVRVRLARPVDVVGVGPGAGDEAVVLLAPDRGADAVGCHGLSSSSRRRPPGSP